MSGYAAAPCAAAPCIQIMIHFFLTHKVETEDRYELFVANILAEITSNGFMQEILICNDVFQRKI